MAKKSKGFGELLKQQRTIQTEQQAFAKLQQKVQQNPLHDNIAEFVTNPTGEVKMSEALEWVVAPYLEMTATHKEREKLFGLATMAWNLALVAEPERQQLLDQVFNQDLKGMDQQTRQETRTLLTELIARKQQFFPEIHRAIVEFQLQDQGGSFYLSVASTL